MVLTKPLCTQLIFPSNRLVARSLLVHLDLASPDGIHPFQTTSKGSTKRIIMYPCARSNPDRKNKKMYISQVTDFANDDFQTLATISRRIAPPAISVAGESTPALVIRVYQYTNPRRRMGRERSTSLHISCAR
jgi:hypothetical protein